MSGRIPKHPEGAANEAQEFLLPRNSALSFAA